MEEFQLLKVASSFKNNPFSTYDFIVALQEMYPEDWVALKKNYGAGGKGAGTPYSAYSRVSHYLHKLSNHEQLYKLDYRDSPDGWGSPVIRYWSTSSQEFYPDEINDRDTVNEGAKTTVIVNKYERDRGARQKCIDEYGVTCFVCGFNFEKVYGELGAGFIHIHHIKPLGEIGGEYSLNPKKDLVPLCPNCHAMIHKKNLALSIKELKKLIKAA